MTLTRSAQGVVDGKAHGVWFGVSSCVKLNRKFRMPIGALSTEICVITFRLTVDITGACTGLLKWVKVPRSNSADGEGGTFTLMGTGAATKR